MAKLLIRPSSTVPTFAIIAHNNTPSVETHFPETDTCMLTHTHTYTQTWLWPSVDLR